ncbi:MAG: iron ABC transporter permease [Hyphomicrobiaceae bacterium]|nr:iron ABC transporter permease [Hyphomicrobiaceae bacterium]
MPIVVLAAALLLAFTASLLAGPAGLPAGQSLAALFGWGSEGAVIVMQEIRLPRALLGLMIGGVLGLAGAVLQGYLRNPLADPGILGISQSAAFGAVLAIYSGLSAVAPLSLPLLAMASASAAVVLIYALAGRYAGSITLILAGLAISSLAGAMTTLALNLSPNPFAALEIVFWMLGSLTDRSMLHVWLAAPFMLCGAALLATAGRSLDALALGEDVATTLGVDLGRVRFAVIGGVALAIGAATAVAGAIGFIGLVVPHLLRPVVGQRPGALLLPSAMAGATLLLVADIAVRVIAPERDLKLGVLTALFGAPFFLWLVLRSRRTQG